MSAALDIDQTINLNITNAPIYEIPEMRQRRRVTASSHDQIFGIRNRPLRNSGYVTAIILAA